jgi:hypothetical protein
MNEPIFQLQQTVKQVLDGSPKTQHAFQALKTQCIGCILARFCTLRDVANAYEIAPELLIEELSLAAQGMENSSENPTRRKE